MGLQFEFAVNADEGEEEFGILAMKALVHRTPRMVFSEDDRTELFELVFYGAIKSGEFLHFRMGAVGSESYQNPFFSPKALNVIHDQQAFGNRSPEGGA
jgi:hypothetical protein